MASSDVWPCNLEHSPESNIKNFGILTMRLLKRPQSSKKVSFYRHLAIMDYNSQLANARTTVAISKGFEMHELVP